ncbi:MAG: c-type cytochrome [Methylococcales bacterium]|jgi:cytochrome c|nr:c-type cytochrome [Methylococcales bacterium]
MKHYSLNLQTVSAIALMVVCFSAHAEAVDADAAKALAKQNNCFRCHGVDKDKDGPAFTKSAAKFKADPKGEEKLLHHLSSGEKAKFPDGHEEPHMILKAEDPKEIKNLVGWILSL